ncbi:MAG: phytanoyl-CoA dioxygenase family protein [Lentisphaeria bacterium]|nr:phytanoyl-CoA dioxygenase family protein [Lentisphaeria bacterium]
MKLSEEQLKSYDETGFVILKKLVPDSDCDELIDHMMAIKNGEKVVEGIKLPDDGEDLKRIHNPHSHDPLCMKWLIHEKLREPLESICGGKVDGIQTMYFWCGSEQRRHQDQYYLPDCFSAWIALEEVSDKNGNLGVQPGSHKGKLVTRDMLDTDDAFDEMYNDAVDELFEANKFDEITVSMEKGDVLLFHGVLIHRGRPIENEGSSRHAMANHYIPYDSKKWTFDWWKRHSFDGEVRDNVKTS